VGVCVNQSPLLFVGTDLQETLIPTIVCYVGTNLLTSSSFSFPSLVCLLLLSSPNLLCARYFFFHQICSALATSAFTRSTRHSLLTFVISCSMLTPSTFTLPSLDLLASTSALDIPLQFFLLECQIYLLEHQI
jgi:hypothetical protein